MTATVVPVETQAAVLAGVFREAAWVQDSVWHKLWLVALAFAMDAHADGTAKPDPDEQVRRLALAMLQTDVQIEVDADQAAILEALLSPVAARCRVDDSEYGRDLGWIIGTAGNRLRAHVAPAPPSDDVIAHEQKLHESECPAEPPIRFPPVLECPCGGAWLVRCSKCAGILRTVIISRCEHLEDACAGLVDGWRDLDEPVPV